MLDAERRIFVDFKQPRAQLLVNKNVDSKNLKMFALFLRETRIIEVRDKGL